jgi:hypothetical protein
MNGFSPDQKPQMNLGFDSETFFGNLVPKGTTEITGSQMIDLYKAATASGFTDKDLKEYLNSRGIKVVGSNQPEEPVHFEPKTFGTGFDTPRPKR